jgi:hypothetical protein
MIAKNHLYTIKKSQSAIMLIGIFCFDLFMNRSIDYQIYGFTVNATLFSVSLPSWSS